jgi:PAS domain S-box-containing protein
MIVPGDIEDLLLRAGRLVVFDLDVQSGPIEWDQTLQSLWGVAPDKVITPEIFEAGIHPDDRPRLEVAIAAAFDPEGTRRYEAEYRVISRADRSHCWVRAEGDVIFRAQVPVRFVGTVQDITDRNRAEEHIRLLMQEVKHRSKNTLAVVQAIAQQTSAQKEPRIFVQRFAERLQALAASHDLLMHDTRAGVELSELVRAQLSHFSDLIGLRVRIEGQPLRRAWAWHCMNWPPMPENTARSRPTRGK